MVRASRQKRASEDDLYRGCRAGQDCPIDIRNKYEHNTLADRILKWVSSFLYFGTLGISSGKGTGGPTGYTPLGSGGGGGGGVRGGKGANVARPTVLVDALRPPGVPVDTVSPDSSLVPLLEGSGGSTTLDVPPGGDIEVIAEVHPPPNTGDPEITVDLTDDPPILEVTPETHPTSRVRSTISKHDNPAFTAYVSSTQLPGESAVKDNVYVFHGFNGEFVGQADPGGEAIFEEIPLEDFGVPDSPPSTSTPRTSSFTRVLNKFQRRLYNRKLVQQVKITDRTFLTKPSKLVAWEFDNPAFDDESVSLVFQQDVNEVTAAPLAEFQDIVTLTRPIFSQREGLVRVSRLGQRGTIRTRSGLRIGGHVHFYTDISPIRTLEDIEMTTFGEVSGDSVIMQPLGESTFVDEGHISDTLDEGFVQYAETALEDEYNEDFTHARLEISTSAKSRTSIITVQDGIPPGSVKLFINDAAATVDPYMPTPNTVPNVPPHTPFTPLDPALPDIIVNLEENTATFFLHPSLLRKHRHKHWFF
ncbi:L2 protein [Bos taurus papillomavirus 6]|uniref:Minor capsid protein L2 n=1 Tax=Bos taurus papillomavirus 6 TaxID=10563 RepID=Q705F1_BPV6|nr:L2 protein [Bos taurus papillomavirus 6]CAF05690.1 L2 protein [Bos taurus papillomavirus 6]